MELRQAWLEGRLQPIDAQLPQRHQVQHRLTPGEVDELVKARQAGTYINDLAKQFNISRMTVMAHLKRRGVPARRPGPNRPKQP